MNFQILQGDVLKRLAALPSESVQCIVTSPPYWGLRDYGTGTWEGGDVACEHLASDRYYTEQSAASASGEAFSEAGEANAARLKKARWRESGQCTKCGAVKVDQQIGLEKTPAEYIAKMVAVFRELRRVLRSDGTCWVNMGDGYAGSWGNYGGGNRGKGGSQREIVTGSQVPNPAYDGLEDYRPAASLKQEGLKPKDLIGMPWRLAFALQEPQHYGPIKLDTDRAWLAALIDGEGTIGIKRDKGRSNGGNGECQHGYSAFISIGNQDRELLDKCVAITGHGSVGVKSEATTDGRGIRSKRRSYGWWISSNQAIAVIRDVFPFLVVKRRQAVLAYNLDISNKAGKSLRGNGPLPASEQEKRQRMKEMCNACNQREPIDLPSWLVDPPSNFEQGWWLRQDIIWSKPNPMPESVTDRCTKAHEYLFLLTKSARYFYDAEAIKEDSVYPDDNRKLRGSEEQKRMPTDQIAGIRPGSAVYAKRNKRSVWEIATQPFPEAHFATFPMKLVEPCILAGTKEGDLVLDPFNGSGTTGLVAIQHRRRYLGIELNPEYLAMSERRLNAATAQGVLL